MSMENNTKKQKSSNTKQQEYSNSNQLKSWFKFFVNYFKKIFSIITNNRNDQNNLSSTTHIDNHTNRNTNLKGKTENTHIQEHHRSNSPSQIYNIHYNIKPDTYTRQNKTQNQKRNTHNHQNSSRVNNNQNTKTNPERTSQNQNTKSTLEEIPNRYYNVSTGKEISYEEAKGSVEMLARHMTNTIMNDPNNNYNIQEARTRSERFVKEFYKNQQEAIVALASLSPLSKNAATDKEWFIACNDTLENRPKEALAAVEQIIKSKEAQEQTNQKNVGSNSKDEVQSYNQPNDTAAQHASSTVTKDNITPSKSDSGNITLNTIDEAEAFVSRPISDQSKTSYENTNKTKINDPINKHTSINSPSATQAFQDHATELRVGEKAQDYNSSQVTAEQIKQGLQSQQAPGTTSNSIPISRKQNNPKNHSRSS